MKPWRETFKKKLDDHEFRDAIYDYILELETEVASLKKELNRLTGKACFGDREEDREEVLDELVDQAQDLDMGY